MKTLLKKSILIAMLAFIDLSANAQWLQTSTPPGGSVRAIAIIGTNLFAGCTNGGVYFSSDDGTTWVQRNGAFPTMEVYSLVANNSDLYAGTGGSFGGGVYKSSDNGLTWTNITPTGTNTSSNVGALAVNGTDIYAGTFGGGVVFKSSLNGINTTSWSVFNTGLPDKTIRSFALSGSNILAGTYGDGVWISPTNSANWSSTSGMSTSADYIQTLAVSGSNVFAGNISGTPVLYRSTDSGLTWTQSSTSVFANKPVYAIINNGTDIYAGTEGEGAFLSTDNGVTWTSYNIGFKNSLGNWYCNQINIRSFAFIGNKIFAGTDCGIWKLDMSTGIMEVNEPSDVSIFPNPSNGVLSIKSEIKISNIKVISTLGEQIYSAQINSDKTDIDLSKQQKGIYFYQLQSDKKILRTGKIIIK